MIDIAAVVTEAPAKLGPLPVGNQATLVVASATQTESGALPVEVFDSGKFVFPGDEFANFNSFVDVSDDEGEGFLYPDLATTGP